MLKKVIVYFNFKCRPFCFPLTFDKEKQSLTEAIRMKILKDKVISCHSANCSSNSDKKQTQRDMVFVDLRHFDFIDILYIDDVDIKK